MALTSTTEIELGFIAPYFELLDVVSGKQFSIEDLKGVKGTLVMFICNHCPFVIHVMDELIQLGTDYLPQGIGFVVISSNDVVSYPQDSPEKMRQLAIQKKFPFSYLYDESQEVARAYDAVCTPDFALFDSKLKCVYRGRLDDSRPGNGVPVTGEDMRSALNTLLLGKEIAQQQFPSMGCSIKWK